MSPFDFEESSSAAHVDQMNSEIIKTNTLRGVVTILTIGAIGVPATSLAANEVTVYVSKIVVTGYSGGWLVGSGPGATSPRFGEYRKAEAWLRAASKEVHGGEKRKVSDDLLLFDQKPDSDGLMLWRFGDSRLAGAVLVDDSNQANCDKYTRGKEEKRKNIYGLYYYYNSNVTIPPGVAPGDNVWYANFGNCEPRNDTWTGGRTGYPLVTIEEQKLSCPDGMVFREDLQGCGRPAIDQSSHTPGRCPKKGNPIYPLAGVKRQNQELIPSMGLLVNYDNAQFLPAVGGRPMDYSVSPSFGSLWSSSWHRGVVPQRDAKLINRGVVAQLGASGLYTYKSALQGIFNPTAPQNDGSLVEIGREMRLTNLGDSTQETFGEDGLIQRLTRAQGGWLQYTYSTGPSPSAPMKGLLMQVSDQVGRTADFEYEQAPGVLAPRVTKIIAPDGQLIKVGYDGHNNLESLTWPDGKVKRFVYEKAEFPLALTGIIDEENQRYATFGYDAQGLAVSSEHGVGAEKYTVSWSVAPRWNITETYDPDAGVIWRNHAWATPEGVQVQEPLGGRIDIGVEMNNGMPRQKSQSQPAGSGCDASTSSMSYDARGNVASKVDFNGVRSCHAYASDRNVETYRVEGLAKADACPTDWKTYEVDPAKAQRKITTKWHPMWRLEARRAEPKLITTTIYNGEKDIVDVEHGQPILNCAPDAPLLPDGSSKIAVVCKRYEQSTEDDTGNLGFAAKVTRTRSWIYDYNEFGQLKTETDPRGKSTTYLYWPDTTFAGEGNAARGHWKGDLQRVTNALQQATDYLEYNKRGQPLTIQYAIGSQELREYHVRGWLTKVTLVPAGGGVNEVTQYDYYGNGLLKKVTQPDGSFAKYTWDDAHRLTDVTDSVGNTVHYELDDQGNRTAEKFKDPQGVLAKTITRTFDVLGRMQSTSGVQ